MTSLRVYLLEALEELRIGFGKEKDGESATIIKVMLKHLDDLDNMTVSRRI